MKIKIFKESNVFYCKIKWWFISMDKYTFATCGLMEALNISSRHIIGKMLLRRKSVQVPESYNPQVKDKGNDKDTVSHFKYSLKDD